MGNEVLINGFAGERRDYKGCRLGIKLCSRVFVGNEVMDKRCAGK